MKHGLKYLVGKAKPGECPLCGGQVPARNGRSGRDRIYCKDVECRRAYYRYYRRDRRNPGGVSGVVRECRSRSEQEVDVAVDPAFESEFETEKWMQAVDKRLFKKVEC